MVADVGGIRSLDSKGRASTVPNMAYEAHEWVGHPSKRARLALLHSYGHGVDRIRGVVHEHQLLATDEPVDCGFCAVNMASPVNQEEACGRAVLSDSAAIMFLTMGTRSSTSSVISGMREQGTMRGKEAL